jgi:hypothetical protein
MPSTQSPEKQFARFLSKYLPETAAQAEEAIVKLRSILPEAFEMVYDNYNWLVVGFSPTDRPSDAIFSIVVAPRWVTLCFLQGAKLPDPQRLLKGGGKQVRNIRLEDVGTLDKPAVRALIEEAMARAKVRFDGTCERRMIIKSVSAKQRPRRPAAP